MPKPTQKAMDAAESKLASARTSASNLRSKLDEAEKVARREKSRASKAERIAKDLGGDHKTLGEAVKAGVSLGTDLAIAAGIVGVFHGGVSLLLEKTKLADKIASMADTEAKQAFALLGVEMTTAYALAIAASKLTPGLSKYTSRIIAVAVSQGAGAGVSWITSTIGDKFFD